MSDVEMAVLEFASEEQAKEAVDQLRASGVAEDEVHIQPALLPYGDMSDKEFGTGVRTGVLIGTPLSWLVMVGVCLLAGAPLSWAMGIALMPALFCGVFFAGSMIVTDRLDRAEKRGHEQRHLAAKGRTVVVTGAHAADAEELLHTETSSAA
jgi:hypothetical protein